VVHGSRVRWATPSLHTSAIRRSLRMLPPHRCCLFLVALLIPASQPRGWADWGRAVTLTTMYEGYLGVEAMVHTWSLGTELS
jgi:peptidoglycan/LPS O-acetylase OafA/YrhL